jgi:hypothetical protein
MANISWSRMPPGRGGVLSELVTPNPEGGTLTIEVRRDGSWLWIRDDQGECRVLAFPDTDVNGVLRKMSGVRDLPSVANYLSYMSQLSLTLIAHEQFQHSFLNELPDPADAGCFYFKDVLGEIANGNQQTDYFARLGDPIPPSAIAARDLALKQLWAEGRCSGPLPAIRHEADRGQCPKPEQSRAKVDFTLFRLADETWVPCGPEAPPETAGAISQIANSGYDVREWAARASELGPGYLPRWGEILGVMANGAPIPAGRDPFSWLLRLQIASALVLAHMDGGWQQSHRRRALIHLALGPVDWAVQAAIVALHYVASTTAEARDEVEQLFHFLKGNAASSGYTCYAACLATLWLDLGPRRQDTAVIKAWGRQAWNGGPQDVERIAGVDLCGYATHIALGGQPIPEWEGRLHSDPSMQEARHFEHQRAVVRLQLAHCDPASEQGMALIRSFP